MFDELSKRRENIHSDHESSRPLSEGYETVGLAGEFAWSQFSGLAPDLKEKPGGDGGKDGVVYLGFTIDVKTARKAGNLIHETGKSFADIFILAEYADASGVAKLVGWEWGRVLAGAPAKDFGYGIINHYIPRAELKTMESLGRRVLRLSIGPP